MRTARPRKFSSAATIQSARYVLSHERVLFWIGSDHPIARSRSPSLVSAFSLPSGLTSSGILQNRRGSAFPNGLRLPDVVCQSSPRLPRAFWFIRLLQEAFPKSACISRPSSFDWAQPSMWEATRSALAPAPSPLRLRETSCGFSCGARFHLAIADRCRTCNNRAWAVVSKANRQ